jgi:hypothetical protein
MHLGYCLFFCCSVNCVRIHLFVFAELHQVCMYVCMILQERKETEMCALYVSKSMHACMFASHFYTYINIYGSAGTKKNSFCDVVSFLWRYSCMYACNACIDLHEPNIVTCLAVLCIRGLFLRTLTAALTFPVPLPLASCHPCTLTTDPCLQVA